MNLNKWMAEIPDEKPISLINIPGTHDSTAQHIIMPFWCKCQSKSVAEQLEAGVRYFDIRLELKNNRLKLVHAIIDCRPSAAPFKKLYFDSIFHDISVFLQQNPTETVILCVKRDDGVCDEDTLDALYTEFIKPDTDKWFLKNRIPSLGECRGRVVLLRRTAVRDCNEYGSDSIGLDFSQAFSVTQEQGKPPVAVPVISARDGAECFRTAIQDTFNVPPKTKWAGSVLPTLESARADSKTVLLNFLSANNGLNSPAKTERYINPRFLDYGLKAGANYGIIIFDYVNAELAEKVIISNIA